LMYRRCNFLYTIGEVNSKQCGTRLDFNDNFTVMKTLRIECKAVINSPCPEPPKRHPPPLCGQIEAFNYNIISIVTDSNNSDEENVTIGVTFRSTLDVNKQPLYFVAFYGNARQFERQIDVSSLK
uniref:CUB domain-containing protein n=1 Tax=Anisakis simplex TaxID=6269 RepID=A0A0M3JGS4_ANISI